MPGIVYRTQATHSIKKARITGKPVHTGDAAPCGRPAHGARKCLERRSRSRGTFQSVLVLELDQVLVPNDQLAVESFDRQ